MQAFTDRFIHDLTPEQILTILQFSAWKNDNQSIASAVTNDNDLPQPSELYSQIGENTSGPNAFSDIDFGKADRILDVGGGKFDHNQQYMKSRNIDLLVWDPYGRSAEHNDHVQSAVVNKRVNAATSMSILNVIPEPEVRLAHINTLKAALELNGKAYFKIWPGEKPLTGSYLPSGSASYYQANANRDRFIEEIEMVFGLGNVIAVENIPNLIIAINKSENSLNSQEILQVQRKSKIAMNNFGPKKQYAYDELYTKGMKLYSSNITFFRKLVDDFIIENRYHDPNLQHEYDKRHGVIICHRE